VDNRKNRTGRSACATKFFPLTVTLNGTCGHCAHKILEESNGGDGSSRRNRDERP